MFGFQFDDEEPYIVANSRKRLYSQLLIVKEN